MESLASAASTYGYTEKQYLGLIYGSTMTRSIYEEQTRRSLLATAYLQSYQDSLTYSTDELEAAYQEDRTAYDLVDCAYVRVNGAAADTRRAPLWRMQPQSMSPPPPMPLLTASRTAPLFWVNGCMTMPGRPATPPCWRTATAATTMWWSLTAAPATNTTR